MFAHRLFPVRFYPQRYFPPAVGMVAPGTFGRTFTGQLVDRNGTALANISTGLHYRFWDNPDGAETQAGPLTTDGQGEFTLTLASTLDSGGIGWLEIDNSDGTVNQTPSHKAFYGPIQVT